MGATDLLQALQAQGLRLWAEGDHLKVAPRGRITDKTRALIRAHKTELLAALDPLPDPQADARRQRALEMLADRPAAGYALVTDLESDPEAVIVALAIRGRATCELRIPRDKYDGLLLLDLIERHCETMH
jgi:hypothetical protein